MPNLCTQLGPNSSVIITYKLWWGKSRRTQYFPPRHALKLKKNGVLAKAMPLIKKSGTWYTHACSPFVHTKRTPS